jgi:hypothetical protein
METAEFTRFVCSASSLVQPEARPARYYKSSDGRIYSFSGRGLNGTENTNSNGGGWVFQSLYTQSGATAIGGNWSSGIKSFAVHPRDLSLYVLRSGSITRYGNCGDQTLVTGHPLDCSLVQDMNGLSDAGQSGWPSIQEWSVPPSIRYMGVDFRSGRIFAMTGDLGQYYEIQNSDGNTLASCANCTPGTGATTLLKDPTAAGTNNLPAGLKALAGYSASSPALYPGRLTGFFIAPEGDEFFVTDLKTRTGLNQANGSTLVQSTYMSSVYRGTDQQLQYPVVSLPVSASAFSK